jgi:phosphatidylserine/phosphatidylglycerophosphate/cardiolipin synthase-like enzyme
MQTRSLPATRTSSPARAAAARPSSSTTDDVAAKHSAPIARVRPRRAMSFDGASQRLPNAVRDHARKTFRAAQAKDLGESLSNLQSINRWWGNAQKHLTAIRDVLSLEDGAAIGAAFEAESGKSIRGEIHKAFDNGLISKDDLRAVLDVRDDALLRAANGNRRKVNVDKMLEMRRTGAHSLTDVRLKHDRTEGNKLSTLIDHEAARNGVIPAIKNAKDHIHILMLEYQDGIFGRALTDLLIKKKEEGVDVRMVIAGKNSLQSPGTPHWDNVERLIEAGIPVVRQYGFFKDYAHDKLITVDSKVGMIGGWTMIDDANYSRDFVQSFDCENGARCEAGFPIPNEGDKVQTHDMLVKVEGPSVQDLEMDFMSTWFYHKQELDPELTDDQFKKRYFPESPLQLVGRSGGTNAQVIKHFAHERNEIYDKMVEIMDGAKTQLDVEFAYIMSSDIVKLLAKKAKEGVRVRVLVPNDGRMTPTTDEVAYKLLLTGYPTMLEAGVELHEWKGYNHGKVVVADDKNVPGKKHVWIASGNPDPFFSGHPKGGNACDIALYSTSNELADECEREIFGPDFSPESSDRIDEAFMKQRGWGEWAAAITIRKLYDAYEYFTSACELDL